jgi:citrate lyase subunit beta/citryl-CoA lyase
MLNAGLHHPDGIILDLEDAVAPAEKIAARHIVRNALRVLDFFGCETMVRINQGPQGLEDLKGIGLAQVDLVLVPKVEEAQSIMEMDHLLSQLEEPSDEHPGVLLMPILESAKGILNAREIANASQRIVALAIGLEDYTADLGTARTQEGRESFFARSMLVNAARAAGIQAIDTVFSDVADQEGLRASVLEAKALGFDGKGCIHPRQIQIIHEAFAPSPEEIKRSLAIKEAFDQATAQQLGVVALGAKMIDAPVVKRALHLVTLAQRMGLLPEENGGGNV